MIEMIEENDLSGAFFHVERCPHNYETFICRGRKVISAMNISVSRITGCPSERQYLFSKGR